MVYPPTVRLHHFILDTFADSKDALFLGKFLDKLDLNHPITVTITITDGATRFTNRKTYDASENSPTSEGWVED